MKRTNLLTFLEDTMLFMIFYSVALVLLYIGSHYMGDGSINPIYKGFVLYIFMLITHLFRKKSKNFFIFSIGHLLLIFIGFLLGSTIIEKLIYVLFALALTIASFKSYISEIKNNYDFSLLVAGELTFFLMFLFVFYMDYTPVQPFLNIFSSVFILLFMLYTHIINIDNSLEIITKNSIQPVLQIKSFNNKIISIFLLLVAALLAVSPHLHIQEFIKLIGHILASLLRFLLSRGNYEEIPLESEEMIKPTGSESPMLPGALSEPNPILEFIEQILIYAVNIGIVIGVIAILCYSLYQLYKKFYANTSSGNETKEFVSPLMHIEKFNRKSFNPLKRIISSFSATNNEKIRKIYYKKIKNYISLGLKVSNNTSLEISKSAQESIHKNISELTDYYEKARYSDYNATKEDLNKVKALEKR